jgi:DNA polymerase-3 subunit gamma/tau
VSDRVLALEFRPKTLDEIVGQGHIKMVLRAMVKTQRIPPAILLAGTRGTGKTSIARIFAAALNCEVREDDACAECTSCLAVQTGGSLDVLEIDAASNNGIEDIRRIKDEVSYSTSGLWRIVILDEAHNLSKPAFGALLKVLEEPPPQTVFLLLTTESNRIPEPVVSRSMAFEFRRMTIENIVGRLNHIAEVAQIETTPELLVEVAIRSQGGMRDAIMTFDQCSRVGIKDVDGFHELFGIEDVAVPLFRAALTGDHTGGTELIDDYFHRVGDAQGLVNDLVGLVRDLLILVAGGAPTVASEAALADRVALAEQVTLDRLVKTVMVLWDLKSRTRAVDNDHRAQMEMAFVLISDALKTGASAAEPIQQAGPAPAGQPLTLAQVSDIAKQYAKA